MIPAPISRGRDLLVGAISLTMRASAAFTSTPDEDQDFQGHGPSHIDGDFSDLMTDVLKDAEVLVRRYPWPTLLFGFAVGYLLSRSREK